MTTENRFKCLKSNESVNFNGILTKFKPPHQGSLSELAITFGLRGVACGYSNRKYNRRAIFIFLLYWQVLSPHLILPVKTRFTFTSPNEVYKQTTLRMVKILTVL